MLTRTLRKCGQTLPIAPAVDEKGHEHECKEDSRGWRSFSGQDQQSRD